MSETDVPRFPQYVPEVAEKEDKDDESMDVSSSSPGARWLYTLTEAELLPESDTLLLWLARFPVENNHPRPLTGRVAAYVAGGEVLAVLEEEKIPKVFKKLVTEGFLGCPVLDASHRFVSFIDMLDLVYFVCQQFHAFVQEGEKPDVYYIPSEPRLKQDWTSFFQLDRYQNATVREVLARPAVKKPPSFPVYRGFSTFSAVEQMARLGPHRVAILDRERRVVGLLTQSMLISLIDQNLDKLGAFRQSRVSEMLPALATTCITVPDTALAIDAFKTMATNGISGVGVVDSSGLLVDGLSVRDLRGIGVKAEHFERLWHPVRRYKEEVRQEFRRQTPQQPIAVTEADSLETAVRAMDDGNIHRVFVVEKKEGGVKPSHVITQRDVLRFLLFKMGLEPIWEVEPLP